MSFADVVRVIGSDLPASAYKHRPWWANEATGHAHAKAWLAAGYETAQVDMDGKKLVFQRVRKAAPGMAEEKSAYLGSGEERPVSRHPAIGALKGTFTIEPGYDLTKPMMDDDETAEWEANLERTADMIDQGLRGNKKV